MLSERYENQTKIASGGMGVIYKAWDPRAKRLVAIKQIHSHLSENPDFAKLFSEEPSRMARLSHKHIVTLFDVEETPQAGIRLIMEFCPGGNLETRLRERTRLPVREVVRLTAQLASALSHAHGEGLIHRDIKPANVLFDKHGNVKLTDFGIAEVMREVRLTQPKQAIGTVVYMSPEQANGLEVDGRSDLFSLGIMMYEMLTGWTPYGESSDTAIYKKLVHDQEELHLQFPDHVPTLVQDVLRHLLRRHREDRMPNAELLTRQLEDILPTLPPEPPPSGQEESHETVIFKPEPPDTGSEDKTKVHPSPTPIPPIDKVPSPPPDPFPIPPKEDSWITSYILKGLLPALLVIVAGVGLYQLSTRQSSNNALYNEDGLKRLESTLAENEKQVRTFSEQFDREGHTSNCQTVKNELASTFKKYEDILIQVNRQRAEMKQTPSASITRPAQLALDCPVRKPAPDDPQLRALLDTFTRAYEKRDMPTLQMHSRMSPEWLRNIETMFANHRSFKLAIGTPSVEPDGAALVTLTIETAIDSAGQPVPIDPIAKEIVLRIPRLGDRWDKILWDR